MSRSAKEEIRKALERKNAPPEQFQFKALRMNASNMPMPPNQVVVKLPHWSKRKVCKKKSTKTAAAKKKKNTKNLARRTKSKRK